MANEPLLIPAQGRGCSGAGLFHAASGKLQKQLRKGEYDLFRHAPMFESDFIQITKRGEVIDVHNRVRMVTVGIACTSPLLPLPDIMLLARPATGAEAKGKGRRAKALELTRLLPLKFVRVSVHDREKQQLRLKFATGRSCYLQLCPTSDAGECLFEDWERLVHLLRPPLDSGSCAYPAPTRNAECLPPMEQARVSPAQVDGPDGVSVRSLPMGCELVGSGSEAFSGGEILAANSSHSPAEPQVATSDPESAAAVAAEATGAVGEPRVAAKEGQGSALDLATPKPGLLHESRGGAEAGPPGDNQTSVPVFRVASKGQNLKVSFSGLVKKSVEVMEVVGEHETTTFLTGPTAAVTSKDSEDIVISDLPAPGEDSEPARTPRALKTSHKARRERHTHRDKDRRTRGSRHHRRGYEGRHKTGSEKTSSRKAPGSRSRRASEDKKEGGSLRGPAHKGHSPQGKDSRGSHQSSRSTSGSSSSTTFKRLNRISTFLRSFKVNLATKSVTSLTCREELPSLIVGRSMEVIPEKPEGATPAPDTEARAGTQVMETAVTTSTEH